MQLSTPPASAARVVLATLACLALGIARGDDATDFEAVPDRPPAELLPPALVVGTDFHVVDPVHSDGLMHRYVLESRFGRFEAYGQSALAIRVHEVAALTELAKTSSIQVVAGGVVNGVESEVKTVVGVATHPVATVTGIPKGIAHLFHGYTDEGKEAVADVERTTGQARATETTGTPSATTAAAVGARSEDLAKRYASRYFGLTGAERRWYKKLGVDPYTDNATLRRAIHQAAKVEAAASFGVRFVGLPAIPGVGLMSRATDAIYNEDPATIRARTRTTLAGFGLSPGEIDRWQNTLVLSPTRQVLLLAAAEALGGVDGRAELFRHALGLTSAVEAEVYLRSVGLLVLAHREAPLRAILAGVRLPAGVRADGRVIVCGAFESVYWTAGVAAGEAEIRASLPPAAGGVRELRLAGAASGRARAELAARGWELREVDAEASAAGAFSAP